MLLRVFFTFRIPKLYDERRLVSQLNATVDASHHQVPFECRLTFHPDDQTNPNLVMPTYTDKCNVTIEVVCKCVNLVYQWRSVVPEAAGRFTNVGLSADCLCPESQIVISDLEQTQNCVSLNLS